MPIRAARLQPGERFIPFEVWAEHIGIDGYDVVNRRSISPHRWTRDGHTSSFSSEHRWAFPAEYDLMARLAGMSLAHRWADWHRFEFAAESSSHVSVWRLD